MDPRNLLAPFHFWFAGGRLPIRWHRSSSYLLVKSILYKANGLMNTVGASYRRQLLVMLGSRQRFSRKTRIILSLVIFAFSFLVKTLHAVDLAPIMHTQLQEHSGMAGSYYRDAMFLVEGQGILIPAGWDPNDTSLLDHSPGYGIFMGVVFALAGGSYYTIQLVQNLLNSFSPVLIFLIAGELLTWRIGVVAGLTAAASHQLSYYSNVILPDSLCALPVLIAVYLLVVARTGAARFRWHYVGAGVMIGLSIWLRPNALLMGVLLFILLKLVAMRRPIIKPAWALLVAPFLVIIPITIRNYVLYDQFALVSANMGIVLWEGLADGKDGERFGAVKRDPEVAEQEAIIYNDPRYAQSWVTPDGIKRDRERVKKSLAVIIRNPFWFAATMFDRMGDMFKFSAGAPLVFRKTDTRLIEEGSIARQNKNPNLTPRKQSIASDSSTWSFGERLSWMRPAVRALQRAVKETAQPFIFLGIVAVCFLSWRRALWVMMVPLYYLLIQSLMHTEVRYTLPMRYFLFIFAAVTWVIIGVAIWHGIERLLRLNRKTVPVVD